LILPRTNWTATGGVPPDGEAARCAADQLVRGCEFESGVTQVTSNGEAKSSVQVVASLSSKTLTQHCGWASIPGVGVVWRAGLQPMTDVSNVTKSNSVPVL
jgi:hypothetical protein